MPPTRKGRVGKRPRPYKGRKSSRSFEVGPPISADSYTGPVMTTPLAKEIDTFVRVLTDMVTTSVTAGGIFNTVYQSDPTTMTQWANMIGNVDEYRVLAIEAHFVPVNRYNQTLSVGYAAGVSPIITVIDNNSVVALSSLQVGAEFASSKLHSGSDPWTVVAKASNRNHMLWVDTNNSPTYVYSIKTYSTGNFASINLGQTMIRRIIQFRGTV